MSIQSRQDFSNDFLFAIAHELKTPISAIMGFIELLKEEINDPKLLNSKALSECLNYIEEINLAAFDLDGLVHDILDVNWVCDGRFLVDMSCKIDILEVIKRSIRLNYDYALRKNITIKASNFLDETLINLDSKRVKQILVNLISNAIKYGSSHSEIHVTAKNIVIDCKKYLQISVFNRGIGMSASQINSAFDKYQTFGNQANSQGLGLAISKQLVEMQNGKIEIRSNVGEDCEVLLRFPYLD
jgi:signal transduction histidine kinase